MFSTVIPKILCSHRFWLIIAFGLIIVIRIARKKSPPPFPKAVKFFERHKRDIKTIIDVSIIFMVLFWFPLFSILDIFTVPTESEPTGIMTQELDLVLAFTLLIVWSGISGFLIGFISVFQSNITKTKRIILLVVCLLPIIFMVIQVLSGTIESLWSTVQLCLLCLVGSWIINMPA
ncbi:MAG: hypothetical protein ACYS3S_22535, partial [Planctomycetota bacterium]